VPATFDVSGYRGYTADGLGTLTPSSAPVTAALTATDTNGDDVATVGETFLPVGGNTYLGYITIGGVKYPVVSDPDGNHDAFLVLPAGTDPSTFPWPASADMDQLVQAPFDFCFAPGTLIATPDGECVVEDLRIGDAIMTADGRRVSVRWIGVQSCPATLPDPRMQPVRISAGALGPGLPHSDLTVTSDHGMILDGLVINASALVNGTTITWVPLAELPAIVTYYHVETEDHDIILANGAAAETFIDVAGRAGFDNYAEYLDLFGVERIVPEMPQPRIAAQRLLPQSIRARLDLCARNFADNLLTRTA